jgi:hypothetical protein
VAAAAAEKQKMATAAAAAAAATAAAEKGRVCESWLTISRPRGVIRPGGFNHVFLVFVCVWCVLSIGCTANASNTHY